MNRVNAIVLAGEKKQKSKPSKEHQQSGGEGSKGHKDEVLLESKTLVKIKGRYMLEYVIDALRNSKSIEKIAVVGCKETLEPIVGRRVDFIVEGSDSIVNNGLAALACFKQDKQVFILTSDIPMITPEAIEDFVEKSLEKKADLCYSVVDKKVNDLRYPQIKRTYARLREGQFTGGNLFLFNPAAADKCKDFVEKMLEYRKSPAKMAAVLGFGFLIRLALGILTIEAVQKKCEKLLGIKGAVVISNYPEVGNDVDKVSDVVFMEKNMI